MSIVFQLRNNQYDFVCEFNNPIISDSEKVSLSYFRLTLCELMDCQFRLNKERSLNRLDR